VASQGWCRSILFFYHPKNSLYEIRIKKGFIAMKRRSNLEVLAGLGFVSEFMVFCVCGRGIARLLQP
jgi:hypothetical protein